MILFPNAKINLGLYIERKRADGYHDISTVFYPVPLKDAVEIVPVKGNDAVLHTFGNPVDCEPEKNLVMKAYRLLEREFQLPPVEISLYKHIPDGAGLGGGSSDASAVLLILNEMYGLGLDKEALAARAVRLGADCPFFVYNRPMVARGIGDEFSAIDVDLSDYVLVLVKPDVSVPTALAYQQVCPREPDVRVEDIVGRCPVAEWRHLLSNDFEQSVFSAYPQLESLKRSMYEAGAVYASMSGSGAAIYALFDNDNMADGFISGCSCQKVFRF